MENEQKLQFTCAGCMNQHDGEPNKVTMFIIEAGSTKREKFISQICEDCFSPLGHFLDEHKKDNKGITK